MEKLRFLLSLAVLNIILFSLAEIVVRVVAPQNLSGTWRIYDSDGLMINKPLHSARQQENGRVIEYSFGPFGIRGVEGISDAKKILVVGDSYTFGFLLPQDHTFVNQLQIMAHAVHGKGTVQFLNAGGGGWGADSYLRFIESYGDLIKPDAILVYLNINDISSSIRNGFYQLKNDHNFELAFRPLPVSTNMKIKNIMNAVPGYQWLLEHSHAFQWVRMSFLNRKKPEPAAHAFTMAASDALQQENIPQVDAARLGNAIFVRLKSWTDRRNLPLLVLTPGFFDPEVDTRGGDHSFFIQSRTFFQQVGVSYEDLYPYVLGSHQKEQAKLRIPGDGHPNADGASLIGRASWPFVNTILLGHRASTVPK
ncbi:MAG: SGNH/GDSL hydrolase family protein [Magnetococcales bacterium]|nr:SGNH/GDSL hydrolase family protein [Magnetococcales bacterium]MBF0321346.1 SGNH/GDSL hydrolase family protein [Magnetococcales bacterium]